MTSSTEPAPTPSAPDAECLALTRQLRRRGTVVLSVFALAWAFAGASGTGTATDAVPVAVEAAALAITAAALYLGLRKDARPSPRTVDLPANWARGVGLVNGVELLAIVAVIAAANASGHPEYIPAASRSSWACTSSRSPGCTTRGSTGGRARCSRPWPSSAPC